MVKKFCSALGAIAIIATAWFVLPSSTVSDIPSVDAASVDYFLKIDGVDGESTDAEHKGEIDIASFSWGVEQSGGASSGRGGGGAGKVSFHDISFRKGLDKSSPILMRATATGEHIKEVTLVGRKNDTGRNPQYYVIKLSDVLVSSYQSSGESGAEPTDSFSLNFAKIEFTYTPASGSAVKTGYDLKQNKKV